MYRPARICRLFRHVYEVAILWIGLGAYVTSAALLSQAGVFLRFLGPSLNVEKGVVYVKVFGNGQRPFVTFSSGVL